MPPTVMRDDAIALLAKEHHLRLPIVRAQRPTVREDDRLSGSPVFVINLNAVFCLDCAHCFSPCMRCYQDCEARRASEKPWKRG